MKIKIKNEGPSAYMIIQFDLEKIDYWLRDEATNEQREAANWPQDDPDLQSNFTRYLFSEASESVWGQLDIFGLRWIDNQLTFTCLVSTKPDPLYWYKYQCEGIHAVTNLVFKSYEHTAPDRNAWGPMLPDLGGDDDVDYSGSYIEGGLDILTMYLEAHLYMIPTK